MGKKKFHKNKKLVEMPEELPEKDALEAQLSDPDEELKEDPLKAPVGPDLSGLKPGQLARLVQDCEDMNELIQYTRAKDPMVRLKAVQQMCPCRVKDDLEEFWTRLFELAEDDDVKVRMQVLHNMCDGSPPHLEGKVVEALELFNRDPDKEIRRKAHKVMAAYGKSGKWNVL